MCVIDPSYLALRGSIRDDDVRGHLPLLLLLLLLMICSRLLGSARRACRWRERCTRVVWGSKGVRGVGGKHGGGRTSKLHCSNSSSSCCASPTQLSPPLTCAVCGARRAAALATRFQAHCAAYQAGRLLERRAETPQQAAAASRRGAVLLLLLLLRHDRSIKAVSLPSSASRALRLLSRRCHVGNRYTFKTFEVAFALLFSFLNTFGAITPRDRPPPRRRLTVRSAVTECRRRSRWQWLTTC